MMNSYSSIYIYYFSGTGNAKISSEWIADEAGKRGVKTVVRQIDGHESIVFPDKSENPLIGFAFPTHGFNAAPIMMRFIASFPKGICRNVFLLNTRAGMKMYKIFLPGLSGIALLLPAFLLSIKGYRCIAYRPVDLPSNWIPLHPGIRKKIIVSIFNRCEKIVRDFTNKLLSGKRIYNGLYSLPIDILISPIAFAYFVAGRFFLSKTFIANYNCTNCGLCIKECPTSSIKLANNRLYWKLSCESCMRCLNHCPEKAIEAAHGMAVGFWLLITIVDANIILFLVRIFNIPTEATWLKIFTKALSLVSTVFIPAVVYVVIHYAMSLKPVKYIIRFTSFTALPFWRRYPPRNKGKKQ